jgi:hypothetical protein
MTEGSPDLAARNPDFLESRDAITRFLFLQDPPAAADFCLVLGCPTVTNMDPAIDLYRTGLTRRILVSGLGPVPGQVPECEIFKAYAVEKGIPAAAILLERRASNTLENFVFSRPIIAAEIGWERVTTVAIAGKPFHMRRALMTARRHWPAHLRFVMRPSNDPSDPPAATWWQTEEGRRYVLSELRAIGTYALQDDLGGF